MIYIWMAVVVGLIVIEASTETLVSIWLIPAGIASLIMAIAGVPLTAQLITFVLGSGILLVLSRTLFKKYMKRGVTIPTNTDRLIGMEAVVTQKIVSENELGEVKVDGKFWRAVMEDGSAADMGETVTVRAIASTKLICTRL